MRAALAKITVTEDARHSDRFPLNRWSDVTVHTQDGRALASGDVHARGGPEAPMSLAEIEAKVRLFCADLAPDRADALWAMHTALMQPETRFADLLTLLHPAPETADV